LDIKALKDSVIKEAEVHLRQLRDISLKIHANPELGFKEVKASALLSQFLEKNGFAIERGICELPTAFRGSYGKGKPAIAILAEYDALPQLGHACGHNLIAGAAVGAAVAAKPTIDKCGGSVLVIGTPAEEFYGGKVVLAERGAFDEIDIAMMVHPGAHDSATTQALACVTLEVAPAPKPASTPWRRCSSPSPPLTPSGNILWIKRASTASSPTVERHPMSSPPTARAAFWCAPRMTPTSTS